MESQKIRPFVNWGGAQGKGEQPSIQPAHVSNMETILTNDASNSVIQAVPQLLTCEGRD